MIDTFTKGTISILFSFLFLTCTTYGSEQETDLLIVGNDTIYLHTFPLEQIKLKTTPFGNTHQTATNTNCWRGYRAIWRIINEKIYLEKIIHCNSNPEEGEQDIRELFNKNELQFHEENGLILAEWMNVELYRMKLPQSIYNGEFHLVEFWNGRKKDRNKNLKLVIKNGKIKLNELEEYQLKLKSD